MGKFVDFLKKAEADIVYGVTVALHVTTEIKNFIESPDGKTIAEVIDAVVPKGKTYTSDVISIVSALAADLTAVTNPINKEAILLRIGAEILAIVHGNVHPHGIDGYIHEFQKVFVGE